MGFMNKWVLLVAVIFMTFATAYSIPIAYTNPTTSNLVIVVALAIITILGFMTFIKSGSKKKEGEIISGQKFTPVE